MDPIMIIVIVAIIAAIILVNLNKQQKGKISDHVYNNDVQQLYLLTATRQKLNQLKKLEDKITDYNGHDIYANIANELQQLTSAFEKGEIPLEDFSLKLDYLLSKTNLAV